MDTKFERVVVNISKKGSSWFGFSWRGNISSLTPLTPLEFLWFEDWLTWPKPAGMDVMMEIRMTSKNRYFSTGLPYLLLVPLPGSQIRTAALQAGQGKGFESMLIMAVKPVSSQWNCAKLRRGPTLIIWKICKIVQGVGAADEKTLVENFGRVDHSPAWIMMNFGKLFAAVEKSGLWWGEGLCQVVWRPIRWL